MNNDKKQDDISHSNTSTNKNSRPKELLHSLEHVINLMKNAPHNELETTFENPNLKKCWETKNCSSTNCTAHKNKNLRCWQIAGTKCSHTKTSSITTKHKNCLKCGVYIDAMPNDVYTIGEQFNNLLHMLKEKSELLTKEQSDSSAAKQSIIKYEEMIERLIIAENKAQEATVTKNLFLATVSHEIRNPLGAVISALDILADLNLSEEQMTLLNMATQGGEILIKTVNDLLDSAKMDAGKLSFEEKNIDLKNIIKEIVSFKKIKADKKGLDIFCSVSRDVPDCLEGDSIRIKQILTNLISNAIKFTSFGSILVSCSVKEELSQSCSLQISVKDTGVGIKEESFSQIFKEFAQAETSTSRKFGGTGLGLTICKKLVKLMDGKIWVESEEGKGSTFSFTINLKKPTDKNDALIKKEEATQKNSPSNKKVLIVDDNMTNRLLIKKMTSSFSSSINEAKNGEEALQMLDKEKYDIILMDIVMPVMDGIKATEKIRASKSGLNYKTPIIAVTANAFYEERDIYTKVGMNDYIPKPVRKAFLLELLEKHAN